MSSVYRRRLEKAVEILKMRFPNLKVQEALALAADIVEAVQEITE